jgi:plastocyanin
MDAGPRISRRGLLMAGVAAGAAGTSVASAQEGTQYVVGMTDELVFEPAEITVSPGDTLVWVNRGNVGHSVTAYEDGIPEDATYFASGEFDSERAARRAYEPGSVVAGDIPGERRYEHTFETEGTYEYFCIPHESLGMVGTVTVVPGGAPAEPGAFESILPEEAFTAAVAGLGAFIGVLGLSYFLLKYGGDYGFDTEGKG